MNTEEVLKLADRLVFRQTGKNLNDLQKAIIEGVWQGDSYKTIGERSHRSEDRVRDVAYKLWQLFSNDLGLDINKSNFRWNIEKKIKNIGTSSSQINTTNCLINTNFQISSESPSTRYEKSEVSESKVSHQDLSLAPNITNFHGRIDELNTLSNWVSNPNTRLVTVVGLYGIGKTTLVRKFVDLNSANFDYITWQSLKYSKSLNSLLKRVLYFFDPKNNDLNQEDYQMSQLLDILTYHRSLLILDDVDVIFSAKELAGQYLDQYQDYQLFFEMLIKVAHKSCVILISQVKCQEMIYDDKLELCKVLELSGLDHDHNVELLSSLGLKETGCLIELYEGNPFYLKSIAILMKDIGYQDGLINANELLLTEDIRKNFKILWNNLSDIEQKILLEICNKDEPVSIDKLKHSLSLPELVNGLQSLTRRCLLKKIEGENILFSLSSVFREYVKGLSY